MNGAGRCAVGERRDRGDVVLDAGLLDVGDGPRAGDEERGLLPVNSGIAFLSSIERFSAPLPFSPSSSSFLPAAIDSGESTVTTLGSGSPVRGQAEERAATRGEERIDVIRVALLADLEGHDLGGLLVGDELLALA